MKRIRSLRLESTIRRRRRGAAMYIMVMGTALIVSLIGLAGLTIVRIERDQASTGSELLMARTNARAAVELALAVVNSDSNWRNNSTNGAETTPQALGSSSTGTVSWILEDSDGSLTNDDVELRLRGIGRVGNAVQVAGVEIVASQEVYDALECSVYSQKSITQSSKSTTNSGPFAAGSTFVVNGTINGDVEGNPVQGSGTVNGTTTDPGPERTMPPSLVWDTYLALATTINYTDIPSTGMTKRTIDETLLTSNINNYGPSAADVYYIQVPAANTLDIRQSRIAATLLVELGTGAVLSSQQSCLWDPPAGKNYPALIVKADSVAVIDLKSSNADLKENSVGINFNPLGEPYNGVDDSDTSDKYPPLFRGLFHIIGASTSTSLSANLNIQGVVISEGNVALGTNLDVTCDSNIYDNPPLGYTTTANAVEPVMGTWLWDAAP